ncbi:MAG: UDP-N-acetylmuramoyl-tripeptide--D-alanyl-D-alanine ligase [Patescibacteria group bacterium]
MIKSFFRPLLVAILRLEARLILYRYQPKVVAITGSVGKTGAKEAITLALQTVAVVRQSPKNYNTEMGILLTIIGVSHLRPHSFIWFRNILHGLHLAVFRAPYPGWLVLEVGAEREGDIRNLSRWLRPDIAVFTSLPLVPAHVEFFSSPAALFKEKSFLLAAVKRDGTIIINSDDEQIEAIIDKLVADKKLAGRKIIRVGWNKSAEIRMIDYQLAESEMGKPRGLIGKVDYAGFTVTIHLDHLYGPHQLYVILLALGVTLAGSFPLLPVTEVLASYYPPAGRGRLIEGLKDTFIFDDSYNASPAAMIAALETLKSFPAAGRKIAVLGDMLELGAYAIEAHREIGKVAAATADLLITVGVRAKFIADGAVEAGWGKRKRWHFDEASIAGVVLQTMLKAGDVVLVKGSQALRLEKTVEEIMLHPEMKGVLLARQEPEWQTH